MKKRLTDAQFQEAIKGLKVSKQTLEIAHGVLVKGEKQKDFVTALGLSKGAISQAVNRVWCAAQKGLPKGFERVTAVLPHEQALLVKKWEKDAASK